MYSVPFSFRMPRASLWVVALAVLMFAGQAWGQGALTAERVNMDMLTVDEDAASVAEFNILESISFTDSSATITVEMDLPSVSSTLPPTSGGRFEDDAALFNGIPVVEYDGSSVVTLTYDPAANRWGTYTFNVTVIATPPAVGDEVERVFPFTITVNPINDPPTATVADDLSRLTVNEDEDDLDILNDVIILENIDFGDPGDGAGTSNATINTVNVPDVPTTARTTFDGFYNDVRLFDADPRLMYDSGAGTIDLSYRPRPDRWGVYNFNVVVADGSGSANAEITFAFAITVNPINDPPTADMAANLNALTVDEDSSTVTTTILQNISFVESGDGPSSNNATISTASVTAIPLTTDQADGGVYDDVALFDTGPTLDYDEVTGTIDLSYTPAANRWGIYNFNVVVADNGVSSVTDPSDAVEVETTFPFTITVNPIDDSPTLEPDFDTAVPITLREGASPTTRTFTATNGLGEPPGIPTFTIVDRTGTFASNDGSREGLVTIANDGILTIDPSAVLNANGVGTITVRATQSERAGADNGADEFIDQTISIDITPVNNAPTLTLADGDNVTIQIGRSASLNFSLTDPDWDAFEDNRYMNGAEATAAVRLGSRLTLRLALVGGGLTGEIGRNVDIDLRGDGITRDSTGRTTITPDTPSVASTGVRTITMLPDGGYFAEAVLNMVGGGELTVRATQLFTVEEDDSGNANTQELSLEVTGGEVTMEAFMDIIGLITVGVDPRDDYEELTGRTVSVEFMDTGNDGPAIGPPQASETVSLVQAISLPGDPRLRVDVSAGDGFVNVNENSVLQTGNGISIGGTDGVTVVITDPNPGLIRDNTIGSFDLEITLFDGTGAEVPNTGRFLNLNGDAIANGALLGSPPVKWTVGISDSVVTFTADPDGADNAELAALLNALRFELVSESGIHLDDPRPDVEFGFTFRPHAEAPNQSVVSRSSATATLTIDLENDPPTADMADDLSALTMALMVDEDTSGVSGVPGVVILQEINFVESGDGPDNGNINIRTDGRPPIDQVDQILGGLYNDLELFFLNPVVTYNAPVTPGALGTITIRYTPTTNRWGIYDFKVAVADNGDGSDSGDPGQEVLFPAGNEYFRITVNPINDPPIIATPPTMTGIEGGARIDVTFDGFAGGVSGGGIGEDDRDDRDIDLSLSTGGSNIIGEAPRQIFAATGGSFFLWSERSSGSELSSDDVSVLTPLGGFSPFSFRYSELPEDLNGYSDVTIEITDNGGGEEGAASIARSATAVIDITPVNDAPTLEGSFGTRVEIARRSTLTDLRITDPDWVGFANGNVYTSALTPGVEEFRRGSSLVVELAVRLDGGGPALAEEDIGPSHAKDVDIDFGGRFVTRGADNGKVENSTSSVDVGGRNFNIVRVGSTNPAEEIYTFNDASSNEEVLRVTGTRLETYNSDIGEADRTADNFNVQRITIAVMEDIGYSVFETLIRTISVWIEEEDGFPDVGQTRVITLLLVDSGNDGLEIGSQVAERASIGVDPGAFILNSDRVDPTLPVDTQVNIFDVGGTQLSLNWISGTDTRLDPGPPLPSRFDPTIVSGGGLVHILTITDVTPDEEGRSQEPPQEILRITEAEEADDGYVLSTATSTADEIYRAKYRVSRAQATLIPGRTYTFTLQMTDYAGFTANQFLGQQILEYQTTTQTMLITPLADVNRLADVNKNNVLDELEDVVEEAGSVVAYCGGGEFFDTDGDGVANNIEVLLGLECRLGSSGADIPYIGTSAPTAEIVVDVARLMPGATRSSTSEVILIRGIGPLTGVSLGAATCSGCAQGRALTAYQSTSVCQLNPGAALPRGGDNGICPSLSTEPGRGELNLLATEVLWVGMDSLGHPIYRMETLYVQPPIGFDVDTVVVAAPINQDINLRVTMPLSEDAGAPITVDNFGVMLSVTGQNTVSNVPISAGSVSAANANVMVNITALSTAPAIVSLSIDSADVAVMPPLVPDGLLDTEFVYLANSEVTVSVYEPQASQAVFDFTDPPLPLYVNADGMDFPEFNIGEPANSTFVLTVRRYRSDAEDNSFTTLDIEPSSTTSGRIVNYGSDIAGMIEVGDTIEVIAETTPRATVRGTFRVVVIDTDAEDADADGVPNNPNNDFLPTDATRLQIYAKRSARMPGDIDAIDPPSGHIEIATGGSNPLNDPPLTLALGGYALAAVENDDENIMQYSAAVHSENIGLPPLPQNLDVASVKTGVFDFAVSGLENSGGVATVLVPLLRELNDSAALYKYTDEDGWARFITDEFNVAYSAPSPCPGFNALRGQGERVAWQRIAANGGAPASTACLLLQIQDGGPNDADMTANGVIHDPNALLASLPVLVPTIEFTPSDRIVSESTEVSVTVLTRPLVTDPDRIATVVYRLSPATGTITISEVVGDARVIEEDDSNSVLLVVTLTSSLTQASVTVTGDRPEGAVISFTACPTDAAVQCSGLGVRLGGGGGGGGGGGIMGPLWLIFLALGMAVSYGLRRRTQSAFIRDL